MNFFEILETKLMPVFAKVGTQRHVLAIRDGVVATIPLTVIGGLSLIIANPPFDPKTTTSGFGKMWLDFAVPNKFALSMPFYMTMALMSIFAAMAIGYSLSNSYKMNPLNGSILALMTHLMMSAQAISVDKVGRLLPTQYLDGQGIFTAIIAGIVAVEVTRFLKQKNFTIKMPDGVPPAIANSFDALVPALVLVLLVYPMTLVIKSASGVAFPQFIMNLFKPLISAVDSPLGVVFVALLAQLLWAVGIHGSSVVGAIANPFKEANLAANAAAHAAGEAMPTIFTTPFWSFYIVIGGSGATLALVFFYLRSRSAHLKSIGKVSLLPAIFNINEPIIFGSPMVFNPALFIPFIIAQPICALLAYYATKFGLVGRSFATVPWTTPAPLGAVIASADWRSAVLVLVLAAIAGVIYYPFIKAYEKTLVKQEAEAAAESNPVAAD